MKIFLGADHAGFNLKNELLEHLALNGHETNDCGTYSEVRADYPDYAHQVANAVLNAQSDAFGILVCGSGIGVSITANRHKGIRAALCWNAEIAQLSRAHNNANILCLPARFVTLQQAIDMVNMFLSTSFEAGRHLSRVNKIEL